MDTFVGICYFRIILINCFFSSLRIQHFFIKPAIVCMYQEAKLSIRYFVKILTTLKLYNKMYIVYKRMFFQGKNTIRVPVGGGRKPQALDDPGHHDVKMLN